MTQVVDAKLLRRCGGHRARRRALMNVNMCRVTRSRHSDGSLVRRDQNGAWPPSRMHWCIARSGTLSGPEVRDWAQRSAHPIQSPRRRYWCLPSPWCPLHAFCAPIAYSLALYKSRYPTVVRSALSPSQFSDEGVLMPLGSAGKHNVRPREAHLLDEVAARHLVVTISLFRTPTSLFLFRVGGVPQNP